MPKIWLIGAATALMVLMAAALAVALLITRGEVKLLPEDSPEGVVQRYLLALDKNDYLEARKYWTSDLQMRCPPERVVGWGYWGRERNEQIALEKTEISDGTALVSVKFTEFESDAPFDDSEYHYLRTYNLSLEEGQWRLTYHYSMGCPPPF